MVVGVAKWCSTSVIGGLRAGMGTGSVRWLPRALYALKPSCSLCPAQTLALVIRVVQPTTLMKSNAAQVVREARSVPHGNNCTLIHKYAKIQIEIHTNTQIQSSSWCFSLCYCLHNHIALLSPLCNSWLFYEM